MAWQSLMAVSTAGNVGNFYKKQQREPFYTSVSVEKKQTQPSFTKVIKNLLWTIFSIYTSEEHEISKNEKGRLDFPPTTTVNLPNQVEHLAIYINMTHFILSLWLTAISNFSLLCSCVHQSQLVYWCLCFFRCVCVCACMCMGCFYLFSPLYCCVAQYESTLNSKIFCTSAHLSLLHNSPPLASVSYHDPTNNYLWREMSEDQLCLCVCAQTEAHTHTRIHARWEMWQGN